MNRRQLLKGLLAAPAVAVAAHLKIPEYMAEEVRQKLILDLQKPEVLYFNAPEKVFDDRPVWQSISGVQQIWEEHVEKQLAAQVGYPVGGYVRVKDNITRSVRKLINLCDKDVREAQVAEDAPAIIMQMPDVRVTGRGRSHWDLAAEPRFELRAGLEKTDEFLVGERYRVGFLHKDKKIITSVA